MRAFVLKRYGGPRETELCDVPEPKLGNHELLIRIYAAGLNPVDYKTRRGWLLPIYSYRLPIVMGKEFAGTVVARGAGAKRFVEGDRVFCRVAMDAMGAFAEYASVNEEFVAKMPNSLDFEPAAGVPLAGLTALQGLRDELEVRTGRQILISGGAGGVGTFAIQIAKWLGAEVATTASPFHGGVALARSLGADQVIDYTRDRFEEVLHDLDAAFDLIGGETLARLFAVVKPGGKVVSIAGVPEPQTARKDLGRGVELATLFWLLSLPTRLRAQSHGVQYRYLFMHPSGVELAELARLIDAGRLKVIIDRVFQFDDIGDAFVYLEKGHAKGKVVVRMVNE